MRQREEKPIRGVVFDMVGTLAYAQPPVSVVYAEVGQCYGSRKNAQEVARDFHTAFDAVDREDVGDHLAASEERERERWRKIVAQALDDVTDPEACFRELFQHFARPGAWRLYPDAEKALDQLFQSGIAVAIASNFDARLHAICAADGRLSRCRPVVVSSEVGFRKPHSAMFRALEEAWKLPAQKLVHVGDDVMNDYQAARDAGWQSLWLAREGRTSAAVPKHKTLFTLEEIAQRLCHDAFARDEPGCGLP